MSEHKIITVANQKGGVGKTSVCQNLSYALTELSYKVLAVDFDPQMNLTISYIIENEALPAHNVNTLMDILLTDQDLPPAEEYIVHTDGPDILPGSKELSKQEKILLTEMGTERFLKEILEPLRPDYDYIIIDTNRAASPLMINALTAADSVLIPVTPEFYSTEGLTDIITTILKNKRRLNQGLEFEGIVFTICDLRTNLYKETRADVITAFGSDIKIFNTPIPRTVQVGEAVKRGMPVLKYDPSSTASGAFRALAEEVILNGCKDTARPADEYVARIGGTGKSA